MISKIKNAVNGLKYRELIFPIIMGYTLFCLIYNFAIVSFSWSQGVEVSKLYYSKLMLGEFIPIMTVGIIYTRVFSINFLKESIVKTVDIVVYASLCFFTGFFYAKYNPILTNEFKFLISSYIFLLFAINILLSVSNEYNFKKILKVFCVNEKGVFFRQNIGA